MSRAAQRRHRLRHSLFSPGGCPTLVARFWRQGTIPRQGTTRRFDSEHPASGTPVVPNRIVIFLVILSEERSEESKDPYPCNNPSHFVITSEARDLLLLTTDD
jgi:hypothetical protein